MFRLQKHSTWKSKHTQRTANVFYFECCARYHFWIRMIDCVAIFDFFETRIRFRVTIISSRVERFKPNTCLKQLWEAELEIDPNPANVWSRLDITFVRRIEFDAEIWVLHEEYETMTRVITTHGIRDQQSDDDKRWRQALEQTH